MRWSVVFLVAALLSVGCLSDAPGSSTDPGQGEAPNEKAGLAGDDGDPRTSGTNWSQPHVHDYWGSANETTLMSAPVRVYMAHNHVTDQPPRDMHTHGCEQAMASTSQGGSVVFTLPPGHIVLPGTEKLEIFAEWEDPTITGLKLRYRAPDRSSFQEVGTLEEGKTTVIPLTRSMTDQGHERRSRWDFSLCAWSDGEYPFDAARGQVTITVRAHRVEGPLPVDPGHPDLWGDSDERWLGNASWSGPAGAVAWDGEGEWFRAELDGMVPWDARGARFVCSGELSGQPQSPVLEVWYASPAREEAWDFHRVKLNETSNATWTAGIPLGPGQTDGVYGNETLWRVWFRLRSPTATQVAGDMGHWSAPQAVQGELDCGIKALKHRP